MIVIIEKIENIFCLGSIEMQTRGAFKHVNEI